MLYKVSLITMKHLIFAACSAGCFCDFHGISFYEYAVNAMVTLTACKTF